MKRQHATAYDGPTVIGVDVSHWQGDISWPRVAASTARFEGKDVGPVRYAIVRTGDGKDVDQMAVRNLTGASSAGLRTAVYHYIRAKHGPEVNLEVIRDVLSTARVPVGFIALDLEGVPGSEHPGAWLGDMTTLGVLACIEDMAEDLEASGHRVVIYTGQAWHWYMSQNERGEWAEPRAGWLAYYTRGPRPRVPVYPDGSPVWDWTLWQFAGSEALPGAVEGIAGNVDLNRFRGDEEALDRWWSPARRTTPPAPRPSFDRDEIEALAARAKEGGDIRAAIELRAAHVRLRKASS